MELNVYSRARGDNQKFSDLDVLVEGNVSDSLSVITLESTLTAHEFYKRLGFSGTGGMLKVEINGYPVALLDFQLQDRHRGNFFSSQISYILILLKQIDSETLYRYQ
jgi:hypothetical protein